MRPVSTRRAREIPAIARARLCRVRRAATRCRDRREVVTRFARRGHGNLGPSSTAAATDEGLMSDQRDVVGVIGCSFRAIRACIDVPIGRWMIAALAVAGAPSAGCEGAVAGAGRDAGGVVRQTDGGLETRDDGGGTCAAPAECRPSNPCRLGAIACDGSCEETDAEAPHGTPCGAGGRICSSGICVDPALHPTLAMLPPNTAVALGTYACTSQSGEHEGNCRTVTAFSAIRYDPNRHQMVSFGGGHASTNYNALNTFHLDTLEWVEEYPPSPCSDFTVENYDRARGVWMTGTGEGPYPRPAARHTAHDFFVEGDEMIMTAGVEGNAMNACIQDFLDEPGRNPDGTHVTDGGWSTTSIYSFKTGTWDFVHPGGGSNMGWPGMAYDPISGLYVHLSNQGLSVYDPVARQTRTVIDTGAMYWLRDEAGELIPYGSDHRLGYNVTLTYYPPLDRFYQIYHSSTWELVLDRDDLSRSTCTLLTTTGGPAAGAFAYDSTNHIIGGGIAGNVFSAFDPRTRTWTNRTVEGGTFGDVDFQAIDYDWVDNVFVYVSGTASGSQTVAYRWGLGETEPPDTDAPTIPGGLRAADHGTGRIHVSWAPSIDGVATQGYRVERCTGSGCTDYVHVSVVRGAHFFDTGLTPGAVHRYRVRAFDGAHNVSEPSEPLEASAP
jgi:hypothetical protein